MATNSNDKDKKIRFGTILEDSNNIDPEKTQTYTAYLDDEHRLSVKRDIHGTDWNIEDSIRDKFYAEFNNQQPSNSIRKQIYGFCLDMDEGDPSHAMSYTNDNANYVPLTIKQREKCDYGSWKEFIADFVGCRPCALYEDGTVYRYLDPDDYSMDLDGNKIGIDAGNAFDEKGRPYNIMIEFKHNWYRMYTKNNKFYFQVANYKVNEDFIDDAFLYNGVSMNYLYVNAFSPEFHMVNSVEKIKSVYEKDFYQNHFIFREFLSKDSDSFSFPSIDAKCSLLNQRKYITRQYSNSSTFGYAQFLYLILLSELVTKNSNCANMFDLEGFNQDVDHIYKKSYYDTPVNSYNKGLFYSDFDLLDKSNSIGFCLPVMKIFGMDFLFMRYMNIDGLFAIKDKLYYETAPYNIQKIDDVIEKNMILEVVPSIESNYKYVYCISNRIIMVEPLSIRSDLNVLNISIPFTVISNYIKAIDYTNSKYIGAYVYSGYSNSNKGLNGIYLEGAPIDVRNYGKKMNFCQFR